MKETVLLNVACVNWQNYLGRGREYVERLASSVKRNLQRDYRFVCFTDDESPINGVEMRRLRPGMRGWFNKVQLFAPDSFQNGERVLFLDLDTVVVGDLAPLVAAKGLLHLGRWGWTKNDYGTGVMVWDAGEHSEMWERFTPDVMNKFRGDQDFATSLGGWDALPDGLNVSYRYHCKDGPPAGAVTVSFHGKPKCHEVRAVPWVREHWR